MLRQQWYVHPQLLNATARERPGPHLPPKPSCCQQQPQWQYAMSNRMTLCCMLCIHADMPHERLLLLLMLQLLLLVLLCEGSVLADAARCGTCQSGTGGRCQKHEATKSRSVPKTCIYNSLPVCCKALHCPHSSRMAKTPACMLLYSNKQEGAIHLSRRC